MSRAKYVYLWPQLCKMLFLKWGSKCGSVYPENKHIPRTAIKQLRTHFCYANSKSLNQSNCTLLPNQITPQHTHTHPYTNTHTQTLIWLFVFPAPTPDEADKTFSNVLSITKHWRATLPSCNEFQQQWRVIHFPINHTPSPPTPSVSLQSIWGAIWRNDANNHFEAHAHFMDPSFSCLLMVFWTNDVEKNWVVSLWHSLLMNEAGRRQSNGIRTRNDVIAGSRRG